MVEKSEAEGEFETGYLQVSSTSLPIEVGSAGGREFKLLQCLFSAQNFISAKYAPVTQTYERLYLAIKTSSDSSNARLSNDKSADSEMTSIVQKSVRILQKSEAGKHLSFVTVGDKLRMEIAGAVAV